MATQVSLLDGALASAGTLAIQTNGTTSAITISSAQVATFVNNPIMTGLTASRAVFTDGSKGLTSNAITGTGNVVMSASPTLTGTIDGAALTLSSSLTLSGGTANGVLYLNGSKVATSGSGLQFDGTNLGLGVTPSTWSAGGKVVEIGATGLGLWGNSTANFMFVENAYYNGGWKYASTNGAAYYQMLTNSHAWFTAPSGTAGNAITFTQAMTLDASGNLGVGTTSPYTKLQVTGTIKVATGNAQGILSLGDGNGSTVNCGVWRGAANAPTTDGNYLNFGGYDGIVFATGAAVIGSQTERARITSGGDFVVGKAATGVGTQGFGVYSTGDFEANAGSNPAGYLNRTNDGTILSIRRSGTTVGTISVTTTATAYNTSSDYRLKENIQPMTGALAKVQALKPCTYNWKADGSEGEGFIAHELAEVAPQAVTGEKDAVDADGNPVYQGIDTSFLVATLTAAIQELKAEFDAYKATHP